VAVLLHQLFSMPPLVKWLQ